MIGLVDGNNFYVSCERVFNRKLLGRPVAVLSNNDGCCVAMSPEFKALGIPRGTPYFQLKDREKSGELFFCSSNYELYGDMSRRIISILREEALDVEQYSIDEAFIHPPKTGADELLAYGRKLRAKILQWVGIPCGVGFAKTKTLAKIANHIGKKTAGGVFVMPDDPTEILSKLPSSEVWGVGRRLPVRLRAEKIFSARDLRDAPDDVISSIGGLTLLRTATELRGTCCNQDRDYEADPDSVSCSRSFGLPVTTLEGLSESIANFTSQAAAKLRKHHLLASGCNIYAQIATPKMFDSWEDIDQSFVGRTVTFEKPTDATNEMLRAIGEELPSLFREGAKYRKSGVVFFGLEHEGAARQLDLFAPDEPLRRSKLYETIDLLNAKLGKEKVFTATEGIAEKRTWTMKRAKLSPRSTTNWNELPRVK